MISVVHVVWTLDVGGLEHVVLDLARAGDRSRLRSRVVCMAEPGALAPAFAAAGVTVESIGPSTMSAMRRLQRLARRLRELRPDVVHTHNVKPHIHGTLAATLARVPVVLNTKHGRNFPVSAFARTVNRLVAPWCACMVGVSREAVDVARAHDGMTAAKTCVVHNGVDLSRYTVVPAGDPLRLRRIVTVARLNPVKDQATLLRAMRRVIDTNPECHLTIAGDGPSRCDLEALCGALGLTRHVTFLGMRDDVPAVLAGAGQFVLPSISEGVSLTLLEAMASGLPVVATRVGGTPEIVEHGITGYLVAPSAPEDLAAALLAIARNAEASAAMGRAGRARVERLFSLDATVAQYEQLYASLLGRRASVATAAVHLATDPR